MTAWASPPYSWPGCEVHKRTAIRHYLTTLLRDEITQLGGRVYSARPSPRFRDQLPCIILHYGTEELTPDGGDMKNVTFYDRALRFNIDIMVEEPTDLDTTVELSQKGEDLADAIAWSVEIALGGDSTLGRRLEDWDPETGEGLSDGLRILSTEPYLVNDDGEARFLVQRLQVEIPYNSQAFPTVKYKDFLSYHIDINRPDWDEETTDPTLLQAEGETR